MYVSECLKVNFELSVRSLLFAAFSQDGLVANSDNLWEVLNPPINEKTWDRTSNLEADHVLYLAGRLLSLGKQKLGVLERKVSGKKKDSWKDMVPDRKKRAQ